MVELTSMNSAQLEQLLEEYPWFTAARREYIVRLTNGSKDSMVIRNAVRRHGLFFPSRRDLIKLLSGSVVTVESKPVVKQEPVKEEKPKTQYYIVGGDYFSQSDFDDLEKQGLAVETPSFNPISATLGDTDFQPDGADDRVTSVKADDKIYTETLAEIYFQQQIYKRAIEIYEKLILLYPEKSAYFASLIEKVKNIK